MENELGGKGVSDCMRDGESYPHGYQECKGDKCVRCDDGIWVDDDTDFGGGGDSGRL